jgi:predicted lipoprotein with Yx(FWY)xxD motif
MVLGVFSIALLGVLAAGCSGGGGGEQGGGAQGATTAQNTTQKGSATIAIAQNPELGKILVDGSGKTLYLFEADKNGNSACNSSSCIEAWPPLEGTPTAGEGVSKAKLGTITRKDGDTQATYNGHPLYYYAPDKGGGDAEAKGQELEQFGAEWYVLSSSGNKAEEEESGGGQTESSGGGSGSSSGGGY